MTQDRKSISGLELNELMDMHRKWTEDKTKGKQLDCSNINFRSNFTFFMPHRSFTNSICRNSIFPIDCLVPFKNCDLTDSSFEGSELKNQSFEGSDLTNVNFKGANVQGCNFTNAILKNVITNANTKMDDSFRNALKLYNEKADNEKADKEKAGKIKLEIEHLEIKISEYSSRTIQHELWLKSSGKEGKQLDFSNIDFTKSGFRNFGYDKNIEHSICRNVIFPQEIYSSFNNVDLSNSVFENCKLLSRSFINSNLTGVNFKGVDLRRIVFTNTILKDVIIDDKTQIDINFLNALIAFKNSEKEQNEKEQNEKEQTEKNLSGKENPTLPERNKNFKCDNAYKTLITNHFEWLEDKTKGKQLDLSNIDFKASGFISVGYMKGVYKNAIIKNSVFPGVLHCDLEVSDLSNSIFTGCRLNNHSFKNSNLTNVDFSGTDLRGCNFENTILENIKIDADTKFDENFSNALNAFKEIEQNSIGSQTNQRETNFPRNKSWTAILDDHHNWLNNKTEGKQLILSDIDFICSGFTTFGRDRQHLNNSIIKNCIFPSGLYADLENSDLSNSIFKNCCLNKKSFKNSNLTNCNFLDADLRECNFENTILDNIKINNSTQFDSNFTDAIIHNHTIRLNANNLIKQIIESSEKNKILMENSIRKYAILITNQVSQTTTPQTTTPQTPQTAPQSTSLTQQSQSTPITQQSMPETTLEIEPAIKYVSISESNFDDIYKKHLQWLNSNKTEGKQLDVSNVNFKLTKDVLSRNFTSAICNNTIFPTTCNVTFENTSLINADFKNSDLKNSNFRGSNLTGADFSNANIRGCNFSGAIIKNIKFNSYTLMDDDFRKRLIFENSQKDSPAKDSSTKEIINKEPIKMEQSGLNPSILDQAEKEHILWLSDNTKGKQLDLSNIDFKAARFTHIGGTRILRNIIAKNTTFPNKIPPNLEGSNLEGSNFVQCKLINTSFKNCNLKNADFSGADIRDCNFENTILDGIKIDDNTTANTEFWRKLVRNLKQDKETLEKTNKELEKEKEELEEKLGEFEEENKQLQSDKERLEEEKSELENDKEVLEKEKEELEEEKESLEEEKNDLENEKEALDEQKTELESDKASLEEEKNDLEEKNGELENEKESLEEKYAQLESDKEALENQVADLGIKIGQLEYSFKELRETNENLHVVNKELTEQKKALELPPAKNNTLKKILNSQQIDQLKQSSQQALNTALGNKCSEIIYKNTKLILATKIPKNVLNNPLIDSLIKICAPHLLLQASKSLPNFKNLNKIQQTLEVACIGSVSNVSSDTIEHVMTAFLPILKELSSPSILKEIAGSEE